MNTSNNKSALLNNSSTSNIQSNENKICNALGCLKLANTEITLKIGKKSLTIFVCGNCKLKFET